MNKIYLDNASTTFLDPAAMEAMQASWKRQLGNPSSLHRIGVKAATEIEVARAIIAKRLNAEPEEVIFTSGGTESNNLAIQGFCLANRDRGDHLIVSSIEHPSVLEVGKWLTKHGFRLTVLPVNGEGRVEPSELAKALTEKTILVSIMQANNEVGTLQDLKALLDVCRGKVAFHTDASQSFTKAPLDVKDLGLDLVTVSSHKLHGPKGVGALYVKSGVRLDAVLHGGGHESGLRAGTLNSEGIVGFGAAVRSAKAEDVARTTELRDSFLEKLLATIPEVEINGSREHRLCNNINVTIHEVSSKRLLFELDRNGIAVSVGSACASGKKTPSHVLLALGLDPTRASESLRISLSKWTTREELDIFLETLSSIVAKERARFVDSEAG